MAINRQNRRSGARPARLALMAGALLALGACEEGAGGPFGFLSPSADKEEGVSLDSRSVRLVERDVEAPEVFQVTEAGLWDGRPSLGGVWVAHPEVDEPERVIIRNTTNKNFVIGALFRKERETPGPRLQVSSDAAEALGMLAGQPVNLNVTALRREEVQDGGDSSGAGAAPGAEALSAPAEIAESQLSPAEGTAADGTEEAAGTQLASAAPTAAAPAPTPSPAAAPSDPAPSASAGSDLDKPYIQIGIFSVEQNARNTAESMRQAGMVPTVRKQSSQGKTFWRVVVGPASSESERAELLDQITATGFSDAYAVTN